MSTDSNKKIQSILTSLHYPDRTVKEIFDEAENYREALIPHLLNLLKHADKQRYYLSNEDVGHFVALFLLAQWRVKETFPILLQLLENDPPATYESIYDGEQSELLHNVLATVFNGDFDALYDFIENPKLNAYSRDIGLRTLLTLVREGLLSRDAFIRYLQMAIQRGLRDEVERDYDTPNFILLFIETVCAVYPIEIINELRLLFYFQFQDYFSFSEGSISNHFTPEAFEKIMAMSKEEVLEKYFSPHAYHLIQEGAKEIEDFPYCDPERDVPDFPPKSFCAANDDMEDQEEEDRFYSGFPSITTVTDIGKSGKAMLATFERGLPFPSHVTYLNTSPKKTKAQTQCPYDFREKASYKKYREQLSTLTAKGKCQHLLTNPNYQAIEQHLEARTHKAVGKLLLALREQYIQEKKIYATFCPEDFAMSKAISLVGKEADNYGYIIISLIAEMFGCDHTIITSGKSEPVVITGRKEQVKIAHHLAQRLYQFLKSEFSLFVEQCHKNTKRHNRYEKAGDHCETLAYELLDGVLSDYNGEHKLLDKSEEEKLHKHTSHTIGLYYDEDMPIGGWEYYQQNRFEEVE